MASSCASSATVRVRPQQQLPGEPLRRLDGAQLGARDRLQHRLDGDAAVRGDALDGVRHRQAGDDRGVPVAHRLDDAGDQRRRRERAGGVVHEDHVDVGGARVGVERGQTGGHGGLPGGATGDDEQRRPRPSRPSSSRAMASRWNAGAVTTSTRTRSSPAARAASRFRAACATSD